MRDSKLRVLFVIDVEQDFSQAVQCLAGDFDSIGLLIDVRQRVDDLEDSFSSNREFDSQPPTFRARLRSCWHAQGIGELNGLLQVGIFFCLGFVFGALTTFAAGVWLILFVIAAMPGVLRTKADAAIFVPKLG